MKKEGVFLIGIVGAFLFVVTSLIGGFLIEGYSVSKQLISETYAIDTAYGLFLRLFGFIPSGILLASFCLLAKQYFGTSKLSLIGFYGVAIFYGLATVVVSIFPCDSGCNIELINPSISQVIHNLTGLLTYAIVPSAILLVGFGVSRNRTTPFSTQSIVLGGLSLVLVFIFFASFNSAYIGLIQRAVELTFIIWIVRCAFAVRGAKTTAISS